MTSRIGHLVEQVATPSSATADVGALVAAAREAQRRWAPVPVRERVIVLKRLRSLIATTSEDLAQSVALPNRRLADTLSSEVIPLVDACKFLERRAARILATKRWGSDGRPLWLASTSLEIHREPVGVVLVVGPSNYPLLLPGVQIVQALAAGNAVLVKPAPGCTGCVERLRNLLVQAGMPAELVTIVPEGVEAVGEAIRSGVDKAFLTGSAETGRAVLRQLAPRLTPSVMELSGCDALFVLPGSDVDLVARSVWFGVTLNGGATCIAPRRVFVPREMKGELERRLVALAVEAKPVVVKPQTVQRLASLLRDVMTEGANVLAGGVVGSNGSSSIRPVIVTGATPSMALLREDVFAPVVSIVAVDDERQALEWNDACPYALAAAVFGPERAARDLAAKVNAGVVVVNDVIVPHADPRLPFAPRGQSGFGVTRGAEGLLEMTRLKAVSVRRGRLRPHLLPPREDDAAFFADYLRAGNAPSLIERCRAMARLAKQLIGRSSTLSSSSSSLSSSKCPEKRHE